eukprot:scaffold26460_cov27-Tisochrysis_lutea.AAC.6
MRQPPQIPALDDPSWCLRGVGEGEEPFRIEWVEHNAVDGLCVSETRDLLVPCAHIKEAQPSE